MDDARKEELASIALEIRKDVVRMVGVARTYGLASALTVVDTLVYIYWEQMKPSPANRSRGDRDRLVLSKGIAAASLYACLARLGFFSREELWSYRRLGAMLQGCPDIRTPGVDAPGGSLGCGLGIAAGLALAMRLGGSPSRVFCVMGDGELQEGVVWESALTASSQGLENLTLVVDANGYRDAGSLSGMKDADAICGKLRAFGWQTAIADGHDFRRLDEAFSAFEEGAGQPRAIVARTSTGRGVSFLEDGATSVDNPLSRDDMERALSLLEEDGRP